MKFTLFSALTSILAVAGLAQAGGPKPPKPPSLTYLYTVNITGADAIPVGQGPRGFRIVFPILSGSFAGPRLKGTVLPVGADWALIDANNPNGTFTVDVRQTFKTDDGAVIQVFETGSTQPDGSAHVRLTYETGDPKYYWMNSIVAVGVLHGLSPTTLTIDTWQLTTP
ncbi:hypothetical protein QBC47DRAFT_407399 [Echria macrotheca]|uniref:Uncharacterized protein n=1 Tax=Echria macrotheca TaxID=438768 RepID=A0AAJ0B4C6_9PEZI|nr:hypothetical protein QBC47DRAFT_407399 [Echria macrotheca]